MRENLQCLKSSRKTYGFRSFVLSLFLMVSGAVGFAQDNITAGGAAVVQNFNSLSSSNSNLPTNWRAAKNNGARAIDNFADAGGVFEQTGGNAISSSATNGIYRFNANNVTTESAIGGLSSGSASKSVTVYNHLKNNAATPIGSFTISYDVEKYRNGSNAAGYTVELFYSTNGTSWTSCGADFTTTFTADANSNGFTTAPATTVNITSKTFTPAASLAQNAQFYFAWRYSVTTGTTTSSAPALGIDNISIAAVAAVVNPVVVTGAASVTNTTATLNGTVNANGLSGVTASFDYGQTSSYGQNVAATTPGVTGSTATAISANIAASGLQPDLVYHFRAVGTYNSTATNGSDATFRSPARTPDAVGVSAPTATTVAFAFNSATQNANPATVSYAVRFTSGSVAYLQANGTLGGLPVFRLASEWAAITSVTELSPSTDYTVDVSARNTAGLETPYGTTATFSTPAITTPHFTVDPIALTFTGTCINTTATAQSFTLLGENLTTANVTVGPLAGFTFATSVNGTYASSLTLTPVSGEILEDIYVHFTPTAVQSYNGNIAIAGGGAPGETVSVTASGINTPADVIASTATSVTSTAATFNGLFAAGCSSVTSYGFEYSTTNNFANGTGTNVSSTNASGGAFTATVSTLSPNTPYYFKAYAIDGTGTHYSTQVAVTTSAIGTPLAVAADPVGQTSFTAKWNAVEGATGYLLDVATSNTFYGGAPTGSLAEWTFASAGTVIPTTAIAANANKQITTNSTGSESYPAGVTSQSISNTGWNSGADSKYWQIEVNTTGYQNLHLAAAQQSSNSGPKFFKVRYKAGSGNWTDVPNGNVTVANNFTLGVTDIELPQACNNQSVLLIQWIMTSNEGVNGSAVQSTGTSRIDNIIVSGESPSTFVTGYNNLSVTGTSQEVTGLTENTNYYYRVRAVSANSTSGNSNTITVQTTTAPATFGTINQAAAVCAGELATFQVTGLLPFATTTITYHIGTGANQTQSVSGNSDGQAVFFLTLSAANNGQVLTVTSVQRTDAASPAVPVSANNTITLQSGESFTYYADADGDSYGDATNSQVSCTGVPSTGVWVTNNTDCDDTNAAVHQSFQFFVDADGDQYGTGSLVAVCAVDADTPPAGYASNDMDCDDTDATKWQTGLLFVDADGDGYDNGTATVCFGDTAPEGYAFETLGSDCNDANASQHTQFQFYVDGDLDGYGSTTTAMVCASSAAVAPAGYSVNNTDCNDAVAAINPGASEVLYNGVDENCDGNLDEGNQLLSQVQSHICETTLTAINSLITVNPFANTTMYRYQVYKVVGGQITGEPQYVERAQPYFTFTNMASYDYATTYSIRVQLQRNGVWLGYYGPACRVSTPALLDNPNGSGSVNPSMCNTTLATIATLIATPSLQGATGYRFRVTNLTDSAAPGQQQEITRTQNWFSLTMLPNYFYGTTYSVEVAVRTNGVFSAYGAACLITSPAVPMINNCDQHMAQPVNYISTASLNKVTSHRFEVSLVDANDNPVSTQLVDRTLSYFNFNMVPGYVPGGKYMVRVALRTTGYHSPFGEACFVYAPTSLRQDGSMKPEELAQRFDATVFPNPYAESFSLDLDSTSEEGVQVKVYDMMGKLIEDRSFESTAVETAQFGEKFPSGVYNIVLTQGGNVKTLRVIKR